VDPSGSETLSEVYPKFNTNPWHPGPQAKNWVQMFKPVSSLAECTG
jgi:hypothetical protein